jgi:rhodanese-related sulfurtransferase
MAGTLKNRFNIIMLAAVLVSLGLQSQGCHPLKSFKDIDTAVADNLIKAGRDSVNFVILDVRTPQEFASGYIAGAVNLDFKSADFPARLDELDKSKTYLVYCRTGGRSAKAMAMMKEKGFQRVYNLRGGITRWKADHLPVTDEYK